MLNGAWQSDAYREQLFRNISSTVVNSAFGLIMGPVGGMFMTVAAPQMLETQLAFNGINVLNAYQYYQQTGDVRLLLIRGIRGGVNIGLTLMQWRLNLSPTCNCLGHCFPAGTLAATEHGQRPIESIRQDDFVWAFDLRTGKWKLCRVLETFTRINDDSLLSLLYRDGSIQVTPGHPFWVLRGEDLESRSWPEHAGERLRDAAIPGRWVDAGDLRVGDVLYLRGGEERAVEEIQVLPGGQRVYNVRVEELACYGVGAACVLVHNASAKLYLGRGLAAKNAACFRSMNVYKTKSDMVVYRRWGGRSREKGQWLSVKSYKKKGQARRALALPPWNTAENNTAYLIPKGTKIYVGPAAPVPGWGPGGGVQIYVPNPSVVIKL